MAVSVYYAQQNAGKRNVSINLNMPGAHDLVLKLCDTADIVVENFRAGTLGFFGLDYETLARRNPRLIYASITGYGQGGPWRSRWRMRQLCRAEAGFTENSIRHYGDALSEPRTDSLSHADVYAGLQAVVAIFAALNSRRRADEGSMLTSDGSNVDCGQSNARMSIFPMRILVRNRPCWARPIARSLSVLTANASLSQRALSAVGPSLRGCGRCDASICWKTRASRRGGSSAELRRAASNHPILDAHVFRHNSARCPARRSENCNGRTPFD